MGQLKVQNEMFVASLATSDRAQMEVVEISSAVCATDNNGGSDSLDNPGSGSSGCFGTFGTCGTAGGCFGTFGTYGSFGG